MQENRQKPNILPIMGGRSSDIYTHESHRLTHGSDQVEQTACLIGGYVIRRLAQLIAQFGPGVRIALYGNGQHTEWLLEFLSHLPFQIQVTFILDDRVATGQSRRGIPVITPKDFKKRMADILIPSSDLLQELMSAKCTVLCKGQIPVWRLYDGLPAGPYLKPDPRLPRMTILIPLTQEPPERLARTMSSLHDQFYCNLETLLLTKNNTEALRLRYPDATFLAAKNPTEKQAIQESLDHATGEIVSFLYPGEIYEHNLLKHIGVQFLEHPEALCATAGRILLKDGEPIQFLNPAEITFEAAPQWWQPSVISSHFIRKNTLPAALSDSNHGIEIPRLAYLAALEQNRHIALSHPCVQSEHSSPFSWEVIPAWQQIQRQRTSMGSNYAPYQARLRYQQELGRYIANDLTLRDILTCSSPASGGTPKITVITPVRNGAKYLPRAILSARAQDFPHYEHIVIDGVSTDGTVDVLKQIPDIRWISEPDTGLYPALNKGLGMARGELVVVLNSDDFFEPGIFHRIAAYFEMNPACEFLTGQIRLLKDGYPQSFNCATPRSMADILRWWEPQAYPWNAVGYFFRRTLLDGGLTFSGSYRIASDVDFLFTARERTEFHYIPKIFGTWHMRSSSLSIAQHKRATNEIVKIASEHAAKLPEPDCLSFLCEQEKALQQRQE